MARSLCMVGLNQLQAASSPLEERHSAASEHLSGYSPMLRQPAKFLLLPDHDQLCLRRLTHAVSRL